MATIEIDDGLYNKLRARAAEAGCESIEDYLDEMVNSESADGVLLDTLFTSERIAEIEKADEQVRAGQTVTLEESRERFRAQRDQWLRDNPR